MQPATLSITIRTPDGEIHKMLRGTQATISFLTDPAFITQDEGHLKSYLAFWGAYSETFRNTVKAIIVSPGLLAGCGVIVVDYQTSKIFLSKHYHDIDKIPAYVCVNRDDEDHLNSKLAKLFSAGFIKNFSSKKDKETRQLPASIEEPEDLMAHGKEGWAEIDYHIEYQPWELQKFEDTKKGVTYLGKELNGLSMFTNLESIIWTRMLDSWERTKQYA